MEKLDDHFEQNVKWHSNNKAYSKYFPIGCKLFVFNSQRNNVSFKLAQKWQGPLICIQHLSNNNILIKPINGNQLVKIHINNCKRAEIHDKHIRLNDGYIKQQLKELSKSHLSDSLSPDKMIVPSNAFDDDFPSSPHIPNIAPPTSPEPASEDENSAESDQPDNTFASADDNINSPDSTNDSASNDNLFSPAKSSSEPNISSPESYFNNPVTRLASSSRLTGQQAKSQNISVPTPIYQPHSLEFLTNKKQKKRRFSTVLSSRRINFF